MFSIRSAIGNKIVFYPIPYAICTSIFSKLLRVFLVGNLYKIVRFIVTRQYEAATIDSVSRHVLNLPFKNVKLFLCYRSVGGSGGTALG
jgi:hypothetical protein